MFPGIIAASRVRASQSTEIMHLGYNPTTSLNLMIQTASDDDWEIDWGDGVWERYTSAGTHRTKTFGSVTSGVARVRSATGRELSDLHWVDSYVGTWRFDVADLCATYIVYFDGASMALTGDVADIKATSIARFVGDSMTLTGGVGTIKATWETMFIGNSMTLTGSPGDIKATFDAHFQGDSMELTYTTQTWTKIPAYSFLLDLATGHLSTAELSQMLIDMDASGITGSATLDFRYNNGAPNALGEIAADNLRAKGYTVLTNVTETMELSYNPTTSLNLMIQTVSGDRWEIDWGDGVWVSYVSSGTAYRTKTFGSSTSGVARVRSATGKRLSDLHRVQSNVGTWSFDVADLCATYQVYFRGDSMAITGDVADIKATYIIYFKGNSMALTGNAGDIKATWSVRIEGTSMALTYTTKTWTHIPLNLFLLDLAPGHLSTAELSQMLIDMDASGITGETYLDFQYNNGAPNTAGAIAADNLRAKGYTVLTNTETMELSYEPTTSLNLRIATTSGQDWSIDWGDGVWVDYASSTSIDRTKTFGSATSGWARIRTANGLSDIRYFRSTVGTWDFTNVSKLTSLTYLYLNGNPFTGDMSGVSNLTLLTYLYLNSNSFTGEMSGASALASLTTFRLVGNFTINYTSKIWASNIVYFLFRPTTSTNPLDTSELDQLLQDLAATTWTSNKLIYADQNNGVRSSVSDAAVATLQGMGVTLHLNV